MKHLLIFIIISATAQCFAETVREGDYVDARGIFKDCNSKLFLTEVVRTDDETPITIFHIPDLLVLGKTETEIKLLIEKKLENYSGSCTSFVGKDLVDLQIKILRTEDKIEPIRKGRIEGLPPEERECSRGGTFNETWDEMEQKLRREKVLNAVASTGLYNKSLKYVPPASWFHPTRTAYARLN